MIADDVRESRIADAMARVQEALAGVGTMKEKLSAVGPTTLLLAAMGSAELLADVLARDERKFALAKGASVLVEVVLDRVYPGWPSG